MAATDFIIFLVADALSSLSIYISGENQLFYPFLKQSLKKILFQGITLKRTDSRVYVARIMHGGMIHRQGKHA
jgi:hypothetical protein